MKTREQLAEIFDVHIRTIDYWVKVNILKPVKTGHGVGFLDDEVRTLAESHRIKHLKALEKLKGFE